ncbi:tRNA nucleotidyltransferase/poly(A) polymerase [Prochlorococcus marinus str. MIT 9515]|uniref:tRNA nucleotidyltransferase/poly(A) polymerase n=1 Tax=Prochlorococcus marinus (strain MIT 9515) TaxID=167542 RepID=A2BUT4_PROM5|nr:CCA tRNA nucleotidyltransferase [Prochlorococcus marinus]ABM71545.1 tRNA nucleotidyltransferase/poly(A) polymerase [Prochlorococcus marinus str. MIT 9515]
MNDISAHINQSILKIPFDLFNIISNYIKLHSNVKVAIVGGYIRDLLINKIHKKTFFSPIDIDIVTEGSSVDLAKFIKKNISNVELCLIKEFEIYDTVELNINNLKIDIASARKETYEAPGLNPIVQHTSIEEDLKRRDFSINAIAFEFSKQEIYDYFDGIKHIKEKELHLLHENSIQDDPSRIIRCARYASRLGFKISKKSLKQSQDTVKRWPWAVINDDTKSRFPPGISIRIRMELSEIYKYDNLAKIVSLLNDWEVISILNKNISIDNKFLRGLKWIKKLKGNYILYLLKNSENFELTCQRFFINSKEKKILKDYLNISNQLENEKEKFLYLTPSNWTEFIETKNLDEETVKLLICNGGEFWKSFFRWLFIYKFIKSKKSGASLKSEGWHPGQEMGNEIKRLRYIEIDKIKRN